jgi:hypothetical protein
VPILREGEREGGREGGRKEGRQGHVRIPVMFLAYTHKTDLTGLIDKDRYD